MAINSRRFVIIGLLLFIVVLIAWPCLTLWYSQSYTKSTTYLLKRLKSGEKLDRTMAAMQLGMHKQDADRVVPALAACLKDQDADMRMAAALALGGLGPKARGAAQALTDALAQVGMPSSGKSWAGDKGFVMQVLSIIGAIGATPETIRCIPEIAKLTRGKDLFISLTAASTLAAIGEESKEAFPALAQVVKDESVPFSARHVIADALVRMGKRYPDLAPEVVALSAELRKSNGFLSERMRKGIEDSEGQTRSQ